MLDVSAFWARGRRNAESGCLEWVPVFHRTQQRNGYQTIAIKDCPSIGFTRSIPVHRLAYALAHGSIPADTLVRHHCDNPRCFEPVHLFLGTPGDNARDHGEKTQRHHAMEARDRFAALPQDTMFLTGIEAAGFLGISPLTLAGWRKSGEGPNYRRHGRRVIYQRNDLIAWSEARSTGLV